MGWFSNTKKRQESKPVESPKKELIKCPVCESNTFEKVDFFYYFKNKGEKVNDIQMVSMEKQDCKIYVGENTGLCSNCGGIIRGLVFLQHSKETEKMTDVIVAECNKAFIKTFLDIKTELQSGKKEHNIKTILDAYKEVNKNVLDKWNMRTHLIIALNEVGMKFEPAVNSKLEELINNYKTVTSIYKMNMTLDPAMLALMGNQHTSIKENFDNFIKALATYIG